MDNKAWKKDRDSITESYESLFVEEELPTDKELGIHADRPAADDHLEMKPGELPDDNIGDIPQEAQALLDELKAPSFDLEMLARERRLSDYIKFLNTLLQGAEEFNSLKQPPEVD